MPDVRQYALESLERELAIPEPIFASLPMPEPLGDVIVPAQESPPAELPEGESPQASLDLPEMPVARAFDLPLAGPVPLSQADLPLSQPAQRTQSELPLSRPMQSTTGPLNPPERPVAVGFDLPMGNVAASQIDALPISRPQQPASFNLPPGDRPAQSSPAPMAEFMQAQLEYSEMSLRDFLAENPEWDELPLTQNMQSDYEPFPLPQRQQSPEARLVTPNVPSPRPTASTPPETERAAGSFEQPMEPIEETVQVTLQSVREELARDRQLYFLGQE